MRKVINGTGIFVCVVLSLLLIVFSVITPFYLSITVLTKPKTIVKIIQSIDYKTVIEENVVLEETVESFGINADLIDKFIKSEEAEEIIEIYADEASEILMGIPTDKELDIPTVKQMLEDNIDAILEIAEENTAVSIPKEYIKERVQTVIIKNEQVIKNVIPVIEPVRIIVQTVKASHQIENTLTPAIIAIIFFNVFMAAVVICLIRYRRLNGFIWLSVDFGIASLILLATAIFSKTALVKFIAEKLSNFETDVIMSTISLSQSKLIIGLTLTCGLALACVLMFFSRLVYIKIKIAKRAKRQENTAQDNGILA